MSRFVCLTSGEWRNLCSNGSIRLLPARVVSYPVQSDDHGLFALAPDRFGIGESSDLIVAEVSDQWGTGAEEYRVPIPSGCTVLTLDYVVDFFPVQEKDFWVFESDALKAGIRLSSAKFENLWGAWALAERIRTAMQNGLRLAQLCNLWDDGSVLPAGVEWGTLASRAINPTITDVTRQDKSAWLLRSRDTLFETCRQDSDNCAFLISCPVEWINLRSDIGNILETDPILGNKANELYEKFQTIRFAPSELENAEIAQFLAELNSAAEDAFDSVWKPAAISLYVRYFHRLNFGKPTPDEIVTAIRASEMLDGRESACALAFLLGAAMSQHQVHSLERQMQSQRFTVAIEPHAKIDLDSTAFHTSPRDSGLMAESEPLVAPEDQNEVTRGDVSGGGTPSTEKGGRSIAGTIDPRNPES